MDRKNYSFKKMFRLHIRIGLLITLVAFIFGFVFFPEIEVKTYYPKVERVIKLYEPTIKLENIAVPKVVDTIFIHINKEDTPHSFPRFVPYDVPPIPLNLDKVNFEYPTQFKPLGIEGTVYLELRIDKEGNVKNVKLIRSIHPDLDKFAVEGAKKLKFSPAMHRDKPVAVRYSFPVRFELE